jgi:hypothetical protein
VRRFVGGRKRSNRLHCGGLREGLQEQEEETVFGTQSGDGNSAIGSLKSGESTDKIEILCGRRSILSTFSNLLGNSECSCRQTRQRRIEFDYEMVYHQMPWGIEHQF